MSLVIDFDLDRGVLQGGGASTAPKTYGQPNHSKKTEANSCHLIPEKRFPTCEPASALTNYFTSVF